MPDNYFGAEWDGYYIAPVAISRDAECLQESNWECQNARLLPLSTDLGGEPTVRIVRDSHWACGWIEWLAIHESNHAAIAEAEQIEKELKGYPILNEDDFYERENEAAQYIWGACFNNRDRLDYMRRYNDQFEHHSMADMMAVARGKYFNGWASELLV
jgi:hypothetical protein